MRPRQKGRNQIAQDKAKNFIVSEKKTKKKKKRTNIVSTFRAKLHRSENKTKKQRQIK